MEQEHPTTTTEIVSYWPNFAGITKELEEITAEEIQKAGECFEEVKKSDTRLYLNGVKEGPAVVPLEIQRIFTLAKILVDQAHQVLQTIAPKSRNEAILREMGYMSNEELIIHKQAHNLYRKSNTISNLGFLILQDLYKTDCTCCFNFRQGWEMVKPGDENEQNHPVVNPAPAKETPLRSPITVIDVDDIDEDSWNRLFEGKPML